LNDVFLARIAYWQDRTVDALEHGQRALALEPPIFFRGCAASSLFLIRASNGDTGAIDALRNHPPPLPRGKIATFGEWASLAWTVEGLAHLGRDDEAARLTDATEDLVASGVHSVLVCDRMFRTAAGIAATAARSWTRAELHHQTAIQQTDAAPYRLGQPHARIWYAKMLQARNEPGDLDRARAWLRESGALYESLGMVTFASRVSAQLTAIA
jgi:hypothetical protein